MPGPTALYGHRVRPTRNREAIGPDRANVLEVSELEALLARVGARAVGGPEFVRAYLGPGAGARGAMLLSFDDGYRDFVEHVLPLLERHGSPAAVFVTTGFVDGELAPYEQELADIVRAAQAVELPGGRRLPAATAEARQDAYERIRKRLKPLPHERRRAFLGGLRALNPAPPARDPAAFLTWDDLRALDRHPLVSVGAHGRYHTVLSALDPERARHELEHCQERFRSELGRCIEMLAYPYGVRSRAVERIAARAGFRYAFTTEPRGVSLRRRPLAIPRRSMERFLRR